MAHAAGLTRAKPEAVKANAKKFAFSPLQLQEFNAILKCADVVRVINKISSGRSELQRLLKLYSGVATDKPGSAMGRTSRGSRNTGGSALEEMGGAMDVSIPQLIEQEYRELKKSEKAIRTPQLTFLVRGMREYVPDTLRREILMLETTAHVVNTFNSHFAKLSKAALE